MERQSAGLAELTELTLVGSTLESSSSAVELCCFDMCRWIIIAWRRSRSFWSWSSNWETTCICTLAWAVDLSSSVCSLLRCLKISYKIVESQSSTPLWVHWETNPWNNRNMNVVSMNLPLKCQFLLIESLDIFTENITARPLADPVAKQ